MARPRTIRKRIISIRSINKITRTMERVAQTRVMKLTLRLTGSRAFRDRVAHHIHACLRVDPAAAAALMEDPLVRPRAALSPKILLVITSNRGLCGGFNTRVLQAARRRIAELEAAGAPPVIVVVGRRGAAAFRYSGRQVAEVVTDVDESTPYARWNEHMSTLLSRYVGGSRGGVEVVSMRYVTKAVQEPRVTPLLPIDLRRPSPGGPVGAGSEPLYQVEPTPEAFLRGATALLAKSELTCLMVEALVSEQMQRSLAMRNATDSAEGMVESLTRTYKRVRQAQVTAEMMEIVAGSQGIAGE